MKRAFEIERPNDNLGNEKNGSRARREWKYERQGTDRTAAKLQDVVS